MSEGKIYLEWGESPAGDVVHISQVVSGRTDLRCPFCECLLIAAKGTRVQHHFRHDGETCRESLKGVPGIPGWDHFHFHASAKTVKSIYTSYEDLGRGVDGCQQCYASPRTIASLRRTGYVIDIPSDFSGGLSHRDMYSREAMIILGKFSLQNFEPWMRETLANRRAEFKERAKAGDIHPALIRVELKRQQSIMSASLYAFRYELDDGRILHKVGRTRRDVSVRLKETISDVERETGQKATGEIWHALPNLGYVEQYILYRYRDCQFEMGNHQEYLELNTQRNAGLSTDFDRLTTWPKPLTRSEKFVTSGKWESEDKRLEATRRGVALSDKMGRPKGSTVPADKFLAKHGDIVQCLQAGDSLSATQQKTGKGYSTVQRVRATLKKSEGC